MRVRAKVDWSADLKVHSKAGTMADMMVDSRVLALVC